MARQGHSARHQAQQGRPPEQQEEQQQSPVSPFSSQQQQNETYEEEARARGSAAAEEKQRSSRSRGRFTRRDACLVFVQQLIAAKGLWWEDAMLLHQTLRPEASSTAHVAAAAAARGSSSRDFSSSSSSSSSSSAFAESVAFEEFLEELNAFLLPTGLRATKVIAAAAGGREGEAAAAAREGERAAAAGGRERETAAAAREGARAAAAAGGREGETTAAAGGRERETAEERSRSCRSWLLLTSEAAAELPVVASSAAAAVLLRHVAAARGFPSSLPLRVLRDAARQIFRTGTALSLLRWVRLCSGKEEVAPECLLQLFVENRFLQVLDKLPSPFSPSSPCLELGPLFFMDNLRLLKQLLPGEEVECHICRFPAVAEKVFCCGDSTCTSVFHAACALQQRLFICRSNNRNPEIPFQEQTSTCPACGGPWRGVHARRAAPPESTEAVAAGETAAAAAAEAQAGTAREEECARAPEPAEAAQAADAAAANEVPVESAAEERGAQVAATPATATPTAAAPAGRVRNTGATALKAEVKEEECQRGREDGEERGTPSERRKRRRGVSHDILPQRRGRHRRKVEERE